MQSTDRLFLSSTKADLDDFRGVATHVAQRLGIEVVSMEDFGPHPRAAVALCREKLHSANIFLGLYAHRYGFQPEGFDGKSITELEYESAVAAGLPVLLFIMDEEQPWPPKHIDQGDARERLQRFKAHLRSKHVVAPLSTPDQLREDLFVHLPKFRQEQPQPAAPDVQAIPSPPTPYVAHNYTLLQTERVIGREKELSLLDSWVGNPAAQIHAARALCLTAVGGMGESALTWKRFHTHAP